MNANILIVAVTETDGGIAPISDCWSPTRDFLFRCFLDVDSPSYLFLFVLPVALIAVLAIISLRRRSKSRALALPIWWWSTCLGLLCFVMGVCKATLDMLDYLGRAPYPATTVYGAGFVFPAFHGAAAAIVGLCVGVALYPYRKTGSRVKTEKEAGQQPLGADAECRARSS